MRELFLLLTLLLVYAGPAQAQTGGVTGLVLADQGQPAEFVNVLLQRAADSTLVQADLTTAAGRYAFAGVAPGRYRVAVVSLGFAKAHSDALPVAGATVEVPVLRLRASAQKLGGVTVTARRPFLKQQSDKLVVNVAGSIVAAGSTALEVLRKVPGVRVSNGRVALAGKASVSILIDGKSSPYQDMNAVLRDLPSGGIDRIEVTSYCKPPLSGFASRRWSW